MIRSRLIPLAVVAGVLVLVGWAASPPERPDTPGEVPPVARADELVAAIEAVHARRRGDPDLGTPLPEPAVPADDLSVLRRLSLVLHGTIPSLEEIRRFEQDDRPDRLTRWTARLLDDPRFYDYFATRLSRSFVGTDQGQFILFRRDRFDAWLKERLRDGTPYDAVVRDMIAERGLWTDEPATNFVTATFANGQLDYEKLAGRSVRSFLGQRIDCAQCHDHPFDDWTQRQFEGLAAFYGGTQISLAGVEDAAARRYEIEDRETRRKRTVAPAVPFHPEWLPSEGTSRQKLAAWITHPKNERFERAIVNRVWGLMFGKPYSAGHVYSKAGRPVDDLPDPPSDARDADVLALLGADFRAHGCDLRRLIHVIAATPAFRAASTHPAGDVDRPLYDRLEGEWAVFPMTRLRPEQVIGSMLQAGSVGTIDQNSQLLVRSVRFFRERDFVREYGDLGEDELEEHAGTVPQALIRMNGNLVREVIQSSGFTAGGRITAFSGDPATIVENAYLACLTRRPTDGEREHFVKLFAEKSENERGRAIEDLYWILFNSPEFAWNH